MRGYCSRAVAVCSIKSTPISNTKLTVSSLCFGTSGLGNMPDTYGYEGAFDELFKLKEEGVTESVGLAMGRIDLMHSLLQERPFDVLISHNRYTLLNRCADAMFNYANETGIAILNAAPFAGGVLAKGSTVMPRVTYQVADSAALAPVREIEALCATHGVSPGGQPTRSRSP